MMYPDWILLFNRLPARMFVQAGVAFRSSALLLLGFYCIMLLRWSKKLSIKMLVSTAFFGNFIVLPALHITLYRHY